MSQLLIVPAIGSRDIGWAEWSRVWLCEQAFQALDVSYDLLDVHASPV